MAGVILLVGPVPPDGRYGNICPSGIPGRSGPNPTSQAVKRPSTREHRLRRDSREAGKCATGTLHLSPINPSGGPILSESIFMHRFARKCLEALVPRGSTYRFRLGPLRGAKACIDWQWDLAVVLGRHEPELHDHYRRLVKRGMRCFDVGMYRGWDALLMTHLSEGSTVSFDGNPQCIEGASQFLAPSGRDIRLLCKYLTDGSDGGPTLDAASIEIFVPQFVKIDVEGAELNVLNGAQQLLSRHRPSLILEVHSVSLERDCASLLDQNRYRVTVVRRRKSLFTEGRSLAHNRWLVCEPLSPS